MRIRCLHDSGLNISGVGQADKTFNELVWEIVRGPFTFIYQMTDKENITARLIVNDNNLPILHLIVIMAVSGGSLIHFLDTGLSNSS